METTDGGQSLHPKQLGLFLPVKCVISETRREQAGSFGPPILVQNSVFSLLLHSLTHSGDALKLRHLLYLGV